MSGAADSPPNHISSVIVVFQTAGTISDRAATVGFSTMLSGFDQMQQAVPTSSQSQIPPIILFRAMILGPPGRHNRRLPGIGRAGQRVDEDEGRQVCPCWRAVPVEQGVSPGNPKHAGPFRQ